MVNVDNKKNISQLWDSACLSKLQFGSHLSTWRSDILYLYRRILEMVCYPCQIQFSDLECMPKLHLCLNLPVRMQRCFRQVTDYRVCYSLQVVQDFTLKSQHFLKCLFSSTVYPIHSLSTAALTQNKILNPRIRRRRHDNNAKFGRVVLLSRIKYA